MQIDRRYGRRVPALDLIDLLWRDPAGETRRNRFELAEISVWGAALRAELPVPVGSTVSLSYRNRTISGKVKHCARKGADFLLGIEFDEECDWALAKSS